MLIEALLGGRQRDLLAPHFSFEQLHPGNIAETSLFRRIAALRYEVYCLECQFLDPADYPGHVELDDYDDRSTHVAAQNLDCLLVGTVRLVQASASQYFPFEEHCPVFESFSISTPRAMRRSIPPGGAQEFPASARRFPARDHERISGTRQPWRHRPDCAAKQGAAAQQPGNSVGPVSGNASF